MRIVVDGASLARPATGTVRWVRGVTRALDDRPDLDVTLARGPGLIRRGGRWHRLPNLARERWWYEFGIPAIARRRHADVLLMASNMTARRGRIPQVVTILDVNFLSAPGTYERNFVRYATWAYRRSVREADHITTISEFSRSEIARHLGVDPSRIEVVYPGLDLPPADESAGPPLRDGPYALYVGATERHKNLGLLLDAWREASPAGLALVIVGQPGRDHEVLVGRASRTAGRVEIRGAVPAQELERWYRHAAAFLFPSRMEGFGYPPLEAMLRGIPVISSDAGSLPEVLGDAALYFHPDDAARLAEHVETVASDAAVREAMIARGRAVGSRFTWQRTGTAMAAALARVVGGSTADRKLR